MTRLLLFSLSFRLLISQTTYAEDINKKLMDASFNGDTIQVKTLLANGADVNARNENGGTALMAAAQHGHTESVQALLANGADVNTTARDGGTALMLAALNGHTKSVQALLANGADVNARNENGGTAFIAAAQNGHTAIVEALLANGADVNILLTKDGVTALIMAAQNGHTESVQALLANGADVNTTAKDGGTALIMAAQNGHTESVQALLANGADVKAAKFKDGVTALIMAAEYGHTAIVEALLAKGADVNTTAKDGATALIMAAYNGHTAIVEALLANGADVNARNKKGGTALMAAAQQGHTQIVQWLKQAVEEPTLKKALEAPAWALAQGYLWVKSILHFLSAADAGATIHLPDETITKSNVEEYRGRYEKRLSLYGEAIKQRGYKTIAGAYKGETTESCANIKSLWVGVIHERGQSGVEIAQDGIEAQVVIRGKHEGKELSLKNPAAIAESAISVLDAMNSDYLFRGEIKDQVIVIKPNLSVLDRWPKWAGPPSRSDLENCTITLKPLSADSGSEQR